MVNCPASDRPWGINDVTGCDYVSPSVDRPRKSGPWESEKILHSASRNHINIPKRVIIMIIIIDYKLNFGNIYVVPAR